jgi:uncharacterized protein (TIGR03067 family)
LGRFPVSILAFPLQTGASWPVTVCGLDAGLPLIFGEGVMVRRVSFLIILAVASTGLCADPKPAKDSLNGAWTLASGVMAGEKMSDEVRKSVHLMLRNGKYAAKVGEDTDQGTYTVDKSKTPATMTLVGTNGPNKGKTMLAIFELDNGTLKVCYDMSGKAFPSDFESKKDTKSFLATYERQSPKRGRLLRSSRGLKGAD